jgi:hypothetical protein
MTKTRFGPRRRPDFGGDDRGVSVTVNYALNLVVAMLLIGGVLTATAGMVDDRRGSAAHTELSVLGERIAADLQSADKLAEVGTDGPAADPTVAVEVSLPERVAGSGYEVTIDPSASEIVLRPDHVDVTVRVGFHHETAVTGTTVRGGDLRITLDTDASPDRLEVSEA